MNARIYVVWKKLLLFYTFVKNSTLNTEDCVGLPISMLKQL